MNYNEILKNAKTSIGEFCHVCPECNGKACKNTIPGPGAKGVGDTAIRNYEKWQNIRVNMDTLYEHSSIDTSVDLWGHKFDFPFFAGPIGAVNLHYGNKYNDSSYNDILVSTCAEKGILAFTGDGTDESVMKGAVRAISKANGLGIPTVKPWNFDTICEKIKLVKQSNPIAIAMDIDAAGLPFLKNMQPPAGPKSVDDLKKIIELCDSPFIIKGIMTPNAALKAKEAGASAIVVSNHGGRVLDQCPATAEVLESIVQAVDGSMKVFVDGGIRTGVDIFKALALGADGVLICRPFVPAIYGGENEGVKLLIDKLASELTDTMAMCGASSISDINKDMIFK